MYIFTRNGAVTNRASADGTKSGIVFTQDYGLAKKYRKHMLEVDNFKASIAKIGSVEGETLQAHIWASVEDGANVIYEIVSWSPDGRPEMMMTVLFI